jgi:hypothetical protein
MKIRVVVAALLVLGCKNSTSPTRRPPEISPINIVPASGAQPGDTIAVTFTATSPIPITATVLRWSGAFVGADSAQGDGQAALIRTVRVRVPATASLVTPLAFEVDAYDAGGKDTVRLAPLTLIDYTPPTVTGSIGGSYGTPRHIGDTLHLAIQAIDNGQLAIIGWGLYGTAVDSLIVSDSAATWNPTVVIDASFSGHPLLTFYARDASGNVRIVGDSTLDVP